VLEVVERILAALIILALVVLLIFLAYPVAPRTDTGPVSSGRQQQAQRQEPPAQQAPPNNRTPPAPQPNTPAPGTPTPPANTPPAPQTPPNPEVQSDNRPGDIDNSRSCCNERPVRAQRRDVVQPRPRRPRQVVRQDCGDRGCGCCCGEGRRVRTAEVQRTPFWALPEPYWANRVPPPYWDERYPPLPPPAQWAQLPPGVCPP
jgi:hypothetical protein